MVSGCVDKGGNALVTDVAVHLVVDIGVTSRRWWLEAGWWLTAVIRGGVVHFRGRSGKGKSYELIARVEANGFKARSFSCWVASVRAYIVGLAKGGSWKHRLAGETL